MKLFLNIVKNWKTSLAALVYFAAKYGPVIDPKHASVYVGIETVAVGLGLVAARDVATHTEDHQGVPQ